MNQQKPATQSDVAKAAGVSTATVSRVLNQPDSVRPAQRKKVEAAINELNYVADAAARTLASKRSASIGAVIPTLAHDIFAHGISAFEKTLKLANYSLLLATSDYDQEQELSQVRTLVERGVDGILLVGQIHSPKVYELLRQRQIPFVESWAYRPDDNFPCVGFDNHQAGRIAPEYLITQGHKHIAALAGITANNDRAKARLTAFQDVMHAHTLPTPAHHQLESTYDIDAARQACRQLLNTSPRPTAIVCYADILATGALLECQAAGINVPEDVAIVGFDDLPLSRSLLPALTSVRIPFTQMGNLAAQYLLDEIAGQQPQRNTQVDVKLVVRQSA